jgi:hypothetical protein
VHQPIPEDLPPNVIPFKRPVDRCLTKRIQTRGQGQSLEFELTASSLTLSQVSTSGEFILIPYSYISLSKIELEALRHWLNSSEVTQFLEKE